MRYHIKYLINVDTKIKSISELSQYLSLYSTIFFSKDGGKVRIVDKENNKEYTIESSIKDIHGHKNNYYTITIYEENGISKLECFDKLINEIIFTRRDMSEEEFFILEDGISKYYTSKAYPTLFCTENKIRAFITEMMCFFGPEKWAKNMGNSLFKNKDTHSKMKDYKSTFLYNSDFNYLMVFLTKLFKENDLEEVLNTIRSKIKKINDSSTISDITEIKEYISEKKPYTIWDRFVKEYTKTTWDADYFEKKMKKLYDLRCKIAHSNLFRKTEYNDFQSLADEISNEILELTKQIEKVEAIDNETKALLNEAADELDLDDSAKDTLIVPAKPEGFTNVFLKENKWYYIRIADEKINQIKYIAAYEAQKGKCIRYYAEVDYIENSEIKKGYKVIYFKRAATLLPNNRKIELGDNPYYAPQSMRYVSSEKLFDENIKTLEQLFN